jgi:hypothetical protein
MLRDDYLLRMIERAVQLLASALTRRSAGDLEGAAADVEDALAETLGPHRDLLDMVDTTTLASLVGEPVRLRAVADACAAHGDLLEAEGAPKSRVRLRRFQAIAFYRQAAETDGLGDQKADALSDQLDR